MESSNINLVPISLLKKHKQKISSNSEKVFSEELVIEKIKKIVKEENIYLISHYYTDPKIQKITEELNGCVSDSLQMAKAGSTSDSETIVVSGVKFMGETAKILSPEKRIIMPTLEATCSLDLGCPADDFKKFCESYPDREIVVYANTSAEVKALADWVVTSSIALEVVDYLDAKGKKILWAPDKHLGSYIRNQTKADMIMWDGACVVHEEFKHVVELADCVGSTSQLINYANSSISKKFVVATDKGIFYQLLKNNPEKEFYEAPTAGNGATCNSCSMCPWMGMNSIMNLYDAVKNKTNEISLDEAIMKKARISLDRMVNFK